MSEEEPYNYLTQDNGVAIIKQTSQIANCPIKNILLPERKAIWLSDYGLPQSFIIDLSKQIRRSKFFKCFGFDCWHDYASNPSILELLVSTDGSNFITWTILHAELRAGVQLFSIDPIGNKYNYLKVIIKETFGASKTYMNQIFIFEENPLKRMKNQSGSENNSLNNSEIIPDKKDEIKVVKPHPTDNQGRVSLGKDDNPNKDSSFLAEPSTGINNSQLRSSVKKSLSENPGHSRSMPKLSTSNINVHDNSSQLPHESQADNMFNQNNYSGTFKPQIRSNVNNQPQAYSQNQSPYQAYVNNNVVPKQLFMNPSEGTFGNLPNGQSQNVEFMQNLMVMNNQSSLPPRHVPSMDPTSPRAMQFAQQQQQYNNDHMSIYNHPHQHQQQQQQQEKNHFISLLNEKLNNMSGEVNRLAVQTQQQHKLEENPIDKYLLSNPGMGDGEDVKNMPLLTQSEKDVKKVKKEMDKWSGIIDKLQENMTSLLEKVTTVQDNMESFKKTAETAKSSSMKEDNQETMSTETSGERKLQGAIVNECVEVLKHKISGFFDGVKNQNEQIIEDNKKLKQALEHQLSQLAANSGRNNHRQESPMKQQVDSKEIERIASSVFERNIKSWENIFYNHQKTQSDLLEDRIHLKINNNIESVKSSSDSRIRRFEEELAALKKKVDEIERARYTPRPDLSPNHSTPFISYDEPALTSKERPGHYPEVFLTNKENLHQYQNSHTRRTKPSGYTNEMSGPYKPEITKKEPKEEAKDKSMGGNNEAYNKIALLMDKLQEKISLRDKKLQQLKSEMSTGSADKENESYNQNKELDSSRDSLEESLFNKKGKPQLSSKPKRPSAKNY